MTVSVSIHNLKLSVFLGVHDWEQVRAREVQIDLTLDYNNDHQIFDEETESVVDYYQVSQMIHHSLISKRFRLIETLASWIALQLLQDKRLACVKVNVTKPHAIPGADSASVSVVQQQI